MGMGFPVECACIGGYRQLVLSRFKAFSAIRSTRLPVASERIPVTSSVVTGFVHCMMCSFTRQDGQLPDANYENHIKFALDEL